MSKHDPRATPISEAFQSGFAAGRKTAKAAFSKLGMKTVSELRADELDAIAAEWEERAKTREPSVRDRLQACAETLRRLARAWRG